MVSLAEMKISHFMISFLNWLRDHLFFSQFYQP
jgi:hypothetical protein